MLIREFYLGSSLLPGGSAPCTQMVGRPCPSFPVARPGMVGLPDLCMGSADVGPSSRNIVCLMRMVPDVLCFWVFSTICRCQSTSRRTDERRLTSLYIVGPTRGEVSLVPSTYCNTIIETSACGSYLISSKYNPGESSSRGRGLLCDSSPGESQKEIVFPRWMWERAMEIVFLRSSERWRWSERWRLGTLGFCSVKR